MTIDWLRIAPPPPVRSLRGEATRRRIVLEAARLFAEHGIDAVAPHDILAAAGQRNASAIQYHFGSHEGLILAVLQPRPDVREPIERARTRTLDELLDGGARPDLAQAVNAWVGPALLFLSTQDGRALIRVATQVIRTLSLDLRAYRSTPSEARALDLIARQMPDLPEPVRTARLAAATTLLSELLAQRAREIDLAIEPAVDETTYYAEMVGMIVGILSATAHPLPRDGDATSPAGEPGPRSRKRRVQEPASRA